MVPDACVVSGLLLEWRNFLTHHFVPFLYVPAALVDLGIPAYAAIIRDKAGENAGKYKLHSGKFQNVKLTGTFDLVFTSPPFFTKEVYEHMTSWKNVEHFMEDFLRPLIRKSARVLQPEGHLVLYIEDSPDAPFIELMKEYVVSEVPSLEYEGAFYYQGTSPRPYYVWIKRTT
jgi:hypothetical protein